MSRRRRGRDRPADGDEQIHTDMWRQIEHRPQCRLIGAAHEARPEPERGGANVTFSAAAPASTSESTSRPSVPILLSAAASSVQRARTAEAPRAEKLGVTWRNVTSSAGSVTITRSRICAFPPAGARPAAQTSLSNAS